MKNALLTLLFFFTVIAFAQDPAGPTPTALDQNIPTNLIGWLLFIGLKTPILGVLQKILKALPQNSVVKFLLSIVDLLSANVAHTEKK